MESCDVSISEDGRIVIGIKGRAGVEAAEGLRRKLLETEIDPGRHREAVIAWQEAEHVEASVLQVLISLRNALQQRGLRLVVEADNSRVREYLQISGLGEYFPKNEPAHASTAPERSHA